MFLNASEQSVSVNRLTALVETLLFPNEYLKFGGVNYGSILQYFFLKSPRYDVLVLNFAPKCFNDNFRFYK